MFYSVKSYIVIISYFDDVLVKSSLLNQGKVSKQEKLTLKGVPEWTHLIMSS